MVPDESVLLTELELDVVRRYAKAYGITEDEAATLLFKACLARRVKKRTGKAPAKVYTLRK